MFTPFSCSRDYLNKYDSDGSEDDDLYPPPPHHKIATTTSTTTTTPRPTVTTTIYPPWRRQYPAEQPEPLRPQYPMRQLEQSRPEYPAVQPARRPDYPAIRPEQQPQPPPPVPPLPQADPYQLRRQLEEEHRRRMQEYYSQQRERQKALELERKKETTSSTTTTTTTTVPPIVFPRRPVPAATNIQARPEVQARPDPRRLEELERQRHEEMLRREQEQIVERARAQAEARARVLKQNVTRPRAWIKGTFGDPKPTAADTRPAPPVLTFRRYRPFDLNTLLGTTAQVVSVDKSDGDENAVVFKAGFNRLNLHYEVVQKPDGDVTAELARLTKTRFANQSGIVYCFSRKDCEEVAAQLRGAGIRAAFYHADMDSSRRTAVHEKWVSGKYNVIVATVAFG